MTRTGRADGVGGRGRKLLLASSSVAALVIGAGTPAAFACKIAPNGVSVSSVTNSTTANCIVVYNSTVSGNVTNTSTGVITPVGGAVPTKTGITIDSSTIGGAVVNDGLITATDGRGIVVDNNATVFGGISNTGMINSASAGAYVLGVSTFAGGITNSGTISGAPGIVAYDVSTFTGAVSNSGTISSGYHGIWITNVGQFGSSAAGGITNTGTLSATDDGILLYTIGDVGRGVSNAGTISAGGVGIWLSHIGQYGASAAGGIANSGTISAGGLGVEIQYVTTFTGGITNSGAISAGGYWGIYVFKSSQFSGDIANSGTLEAGNIGIGFLQTPTVASGITNSGTIAAGGYGIYFSEVNQFGSSAGGGITNSGLISAGGVGGEGIYLLSVETFTGSISNSGTISGGNYGIEILNTTQFTGGISNSGKIAGGANGIWLDQVSTFGGGIGNSGTISAGGYAIEVLSVGHFGGGITNSGSISGSIDMGIWVDEVSTFGGGIGNSGTISAGQYGIYVLSVGSFGSSSGGGITNSGVVTANSAYGIWINDVNTFAGGVSNSGTISAGRDGIDISHISLFGNSSAGGVTNSGVVSAGGSGNGIWVNQVGTFFGGIKNSGTVSAGKVGIYASHMAVFGASGGGGIVNSGLISAAGAGIAAGNIASFYGNISNSGTIVGHTGISIAPNLTFAGGAIVNSGAITGTGGTAINLTSATGAVALDVNGGTISGDMTATTGRSDTLNFMLGLGTFTYSDNFTGFDQVNINSGTVVLNGAANAATNVDVLGGTLAGIGSIDPATVTIHSGGTLAPGTPGGGVGTFAIAGSLVFNAGSYYDIALTSTTHSLTEVTGSPGTVTINGGTVLLAPGGPLGAHYGASMFPILTSTGTLSGTFNPTVGYSGVLQLSSQPSLSYGSDVTNNVYLSYGPSTVDLATPPGANQNQQNVINGINNAILSGDLVPPGFQKLGGLSDQGLLNVLSQLDGEAATGAEHSAFDLMTEFIELMLDPTAQGGNGNGGGGLASGFAPDQIASLPPDIAVAYAEVLKAPPKPDFDQRWGSWGTAYGGNNFIAGNPSVGSSSVTAQTFGFAAGTDYHFTPDTKAGFALAGGGTDWGLANALGGGRSDAFQFGVYGTTRSGPAYLSAALALANHWFTTNRVALADQIIASFSGQSYAARLESGYRYPVWQTLGVTPYGALQVQDFHTPTYSETDLSGGGLGLTYNAANAVDTRGELGARFDDPTLLDGLPLILRGRVAWAHDWVSNPALSAVFESLPGSSFVVNGAPIPRDSALASAGAQLFLTARWSLLARFDGEFAPGSQTYAGTGTLRYTW